MFDDPAVGKALEKEYEKRKRPRIARFVLAKVSLVTFAAMDALRFASPWIPGHTTLCKAGAAFQERILKTWCPCGPKADGRTRQTRAEQQAAAFADANNEEEPDDDIIEEAERAMADEAVREPTARETQEVTAESFAAQGMDLLQKAYPDHSSTKVLDQWGGGVNDTPLFEDANLVHIVMHKAGTMLGFMKCLMTKREIFVDEVLVDLPLCKGKALASHMMDKATTLHKKPQLVRLQVDIENAPAIFLYKGDEEKGKKGWGMEWWEPRPKRTSAFYKVEELCDAGCKFMEGPRLQVGAYAKALADAKPLEEGIEFYVMATAALKGADFVGVVDDLEAPNGATQVPPPLDSKEMFLPDDFAEVKGEDEVKRTKLGDAESWGHATHPVFKPTGDAARFTNVPVSKRKGTSMYMVKLGSGVRSALHMPNLVKRLAMSLHSPKRMMPLRFWWGGDDAKHMKEHFGPMMEEALDLERHGTTLDLPGELPPWDLTDGKMSKRELETLPGTKKNAGKRPVRSVLALGVFIRPVFVWVYDGATTMAMAGVTLGSQFADVFSMRKNKEMGTFHVIAHLAAGETLVQLAERLAPGCSTDPEHEYHWLIEYLPRINRHSRNGQLQAVTEEPERERDVQAAQGIGKHAKKAAAILNDDSNSDGRTDVRRPYIDPVIRERYDDETFIPDINGDQDDALTRTLDHVGLVRVPYLPKHGRKLEKAMWTPDELEDDTKGPRAGGLFFGLCILHILMRTMESCLKRLLKIMMTRYTTSQKDKAIIDEKLNERLQKRLNLRWLITTNEQNVLNKLQINGKEGHAIMQDLPKDEEEGLGELLSAVTDTYAALGCEETNTKLLQWRIVLMHWAIAMTAAYVTHATADDRRAFRKHSRFYVMEKANICAGITTWYDWQMYSIASKVFDYYGSFFAICQQGMEACQKRSNAFARMSNHMANVGRIPLRIIRAGRDKVVSYLADRAKNLKTPECFMFMRQLMNFFATWYDNFEHVEELKREGKTCDWKTEYVPKWRSFVCISVIYRIIAAKCSWNAATKMRQAAVIQWERPEDGRTFKVKVYDEHRRKLVEEMKAYYAPLPWERTRGLVPEEKLDERGIKDRRSKYQASRRARWAARDRDPELWRPMTYVATV